MREREREREREKVDEPSWSINHRGLAYHYTAYIYRERLRERREMNSPGQLITEALHAATLLIYIADEPHCQLSTEALHTITLLIFI